MRFEISESIGEFIEIIYIFLSPHLVFPSPSGTQDRMAKSNANSRIISYNNYHKYGVIILSESQLIEYKESWRYDDV